MQIALPVEVDPAVWAAVVVEHGGQDEQAPDPVQPVQLEGVAVQDAADAEHLALLHSGKHGPWCGSSYIPIKAEKS